MHVELENYSVNLIILNIGSFLVPLSSQFCLNVLMRIGDMVSAFAIFNFAQTSCSQCIMYVIKSSAQVQCDATSVTLQVTVDSWNFPP